MALGLTVVAVLGVLGLSAALLPDSLTGTGSRTEEPPAAAAGVAPDAGAEASSAPSAEPSITPSPSRTAPKATPKPKATTPRPVGKAPSPRRTTPKATRTPTARPSATVTTTRAAAPSSAGSGQDDQEDEVIRLVNVERGKAGCGSVELNTKLRTAIRLHAEEVGKHAFPYLSHVSDDGRDFVTRAKAQGYTAAGGENIARGQRDAGSVMESWMNSEGHRANILNCSFKAIGVGRVKASDGSLVWGQLFGRS